MSVLAFQTVGAGPTPVRTRLRITRRGRLVLTVSAAAPLVIAAALLALNGGGAEASGHTAPAHFDSVVVGDGESLWSVAQRVAPSADPREVVDELAQLNGLTSTQVHAGEQLAVPLEYSR